MAHPAGEQGSALLVSPAQTAGKYDISKQKKVPPLIKKARPVFLSLMPNIYYGWQKGQTPLAYIYI